MMNTKAILQSVDLVHLIETSLREPGQPKGRWTFWRCPFHQNDQTPSLGVNREQGRWFCFACRKGGDAITWLREYHGMTFVEACTALGGAAQMNVSRSIDRPCTDSQSDTNRSPDALQPAWKEIVLRCEQLLWEPAGKRARDYLHQRGLTDATLASPHFRVGYSPGMTIQGVWVERGILLPCFTIQPNLEIDYISSIKIRRPVGDPKYRKLPGHGASLSGLYGADWVRGSDVVFVTEGEFDALLLHQEAGDLVGVCTLGGASDRLDFARFGVNFLCARHILIAYDQDAAGQRGAEAWEGLSERVICASLPKGKDITEFWQLGGSLAAWVMDTLKAHGIE